MALATASAKAVEDAEEAAGVFLSNRDITSMYQNANSYVGTVGEANTILTEIWPNEHTAWDGPADEEAGARTARQEALLRMATTMLDREVFWRGCRYRADQALEWPRTGFTAGFVTSGDGLDRFSVGRTIFFDEVPVELKQAQVLCAALDLAAADRSADDPLEAFSVTSSKAGSVTSHHGGVTPKRISDRVLFWLRPEWHSGTRTRRRQLGTMEIVR